MRRVADGSKGISAQRRIDVPPESMYSEVENVRCSRTINGGIVPSAAFEAWAAFFQPMPTQGKPPKGWKNSTDVEEQSVWIIPPSEVILFRCLAVRGAMACNWGR